jgi:hypothetical protein
MTTYLVQWQIDIDGQPTPEAAARKALQHLVEMAETHPVRVTDQETGIETYVDLLEPTEEETHRIADDLLNDEPEDASSLFGLPDDDLPPYQEQDNETSF